MGNDIFMSEKITKRKLNFKDPHDFLAIEMLTRSRGQPKPVFARRVGEIMTRSYPAGQSPDSGELKSDFDNSKNQSDSDYN